MVLYIKVSDEEIVSRLSGRRICRECQTPYHIQFNPSAQEGVCDKCGGELYQRADDNPATIRARLATYHEQTAPLIEYYQQIGVLREIDGEGGVTEITASVLTAVQELIKPKAAFEMTYA
jgi:adenylate kinase